MTTLYLRDSPSNAADPARAVPPFHRWTAIVVVTALLTWARLSESAHFDKAPEFPSQDPKEWIGAPQSMKALAGKVVILDVWTFG